MNGANGARPPRVGFTRRRLRAQDPDELREGRLVLRTAGPAPRSAWGASQARTHHARAVGAAGPAGPSAAAPKTSASIQAVKAQSPAPPAQLPAPRAVCQPPREDGPSTCLGTTLQQVLHIRGNGSFKENQGAGPRMHTAPRGPPAHETPEGGTELPLVSHGCRREFRPKQGM